MTDVLIALGVVIFAVVVQLLLSLPRYNRGSRVLRPLAAFQRLRRAIGLAIEDGKRLHVSLGKASLLEPTNTSALAGLSILERIGQLSTSSDRPPLASSGDGGVSILSQDTLRAAYRISNAIDQYDPDRGRLTGVTPFSYIAGTLPIIRQENTSAHILVGNFGPEVGLLNQAAEQQGSFTLAASDSLPAQAVLYASSEETLIGEELYAIPAYLSPAAKPFYASLRVQDLLRWALIIFMIVAVVLKLIGISLL